MICTRCHAKLGKLNSAGEPMIRNRGLVVKAGGVVALCPKCGGDVAFPADLAKALSGKLVLFFRAPPKS